MAIDLIKQHSHLGDGTFLVRPSETFVGGYVISFLRKDEVHHVPIRDRQLENGHVRYYLVDQVFFDSLFNLITHYKKHPLKSPYTKLQIVQETVDVWVENSLILMFISRKLNIYARAKLGTITKTMSMKRIVKTDDNDDNGDDDDSNDNDSNEDNDDIEHNESNDSS